MDMQNVSNLQISEGAVRTIHDKDNRLIWGRLAYDTKYVGNSEQRNLPKGYTQVLGIRAGQTSYFDIATTIGTDDSFEYSYSVSLAKAPVHWGYRGATNYDSANSFNGTYAGSGRSVVFANSSSVNTNTQTTEFLDIDTRLDFKYDGDTKTASIPGYTFTKSPGFAPDIEPPQNHFVLNGTYITSTNKYTPSTAGNIIYRFKSAECDIYPCVRDSDGKVGLYDVKRNIFIPPTAGTFTVVTGDVVPTPDTPIPVQVVTGKQTITISDGIDPEAFPISLGSLELCKIGDYQDYIYKSGDDWYVHKATGKAIFNGTEEGWSNDTSGSYLRVFHSLENALYAPGRVADGYSNYFIPSATNAYGIYLRNQNHVYFYPQSSITTLADFKTWLSTHNTNLYYPLATPTDTKITDATLVGQLEAIHKWLTRYGYNATVSGDLPIVLQRDSLQ